MFENFVQNKIEKENIIVNKFWELNPSIKEIPREVFVKSGLSDFTKNYILNDSDEKIKKDETEIKIEKANKLYFNYTIRPKWTLLTILFNNFESRPPNDILKKLKLFPFYNFYTDAIENCIRSNSQIFSTKNEITEIIDGTNDAIYQKLIIELNNVKIKNFFHRIFKLRYDEENEYNLESAIPFSFVKIFLEDKSFTELTKKFSVIKNLTEESEISLKDIIKVMNGKFTPGEKEKGKEVNKTDVKENDENKNKILPVDHRFEEGTFSSSIDWGHPKDETIEELSMSETEVRDKTHKKPNEQKDALKKDKGHIEIYSEDLIEANKTEHIKEAIPETDESRNKSAIKNLFNKKQLEKISSQVYNSDLINREKSFDKLVRYETWNEATKHLKEIFQTNRVDIYNKDVIFFVNLLNNYYKHRE